jgi:heavy metal sensor kinase
MNHPRSIRLKLISLYVGLLVIVFLVFGAFIYWSFHQFLLGALDRTLTRRADQIAVMILEKLPTRGAGYVAGEIQALYAFELNERVIRIMDAAGRILYASPNAGKLAPLPPALLAAPHTVRNVFPATGAELRVVTVHHRLADGQDYVVEVGGPETDVEGDLHNLLLTLGIVSPLLLGGAIVAGYFLLGRALRPVDQIVASAERITLKNLSERLPVAATGDEFERISNALNRMIQRLNEAFQVATRFSADASHELRTPLTIIRGELEALSRDPSLTGEPGERVADILEEVERLGHIVEGLLLVSRLEAGEVQMHFESVDLGALARSVVDQMELLSEEKQQQVRLEIDPAVYVEGDKIRLEQVVVNLLDNAIKYTPKGGTIGLKVAKEGRGAVFEITDTGIGIAAAALPHIFDRFFRAEEVRARRLEGSGLGLAIVRSIVEANGGEIRAASDGSNGTCMRVELPLNKSERN